MKILVMTILINIRLLIGIKKYKYKIYEFEDIVF